MDDSSYFRVAVATTNKVRHRLYVALCFLVVVSVLITPLLNTLLLSLSSLLIALSGLFIFLVFSKRPTPHLLLLTEKGQVNLVFIARHSNRPAMTTAAKPLKIDSMPSTYELSQDMQIQSGSWVLFGCLHIKLQNRLSAQITWLTLYSDQIMASDWCRLRRICLRCNRPAPIS